MELNKYVMLQSNVVVDITFSETQPQDYILVAFGVEVEIGWVFNGTNFEPAPVKKWAIVENAVVQNIVLSTVPMSNYIEIPENTTVGIGYTYNGTTFTAPVVIQKRYITVLALRNRFTQAERIAMDLASFHNSSLPNNSPANVLAAALRDNKEQTASATYIDLDRLDTRTGIMSLEGIILAPGRALEILDSPIKESEKAKV